MTAWPCLCDLSPESHNHPPSPRPRPTTTPDDGHVHDTAARVYVQTLEEARLARAAELVSRISIISDPGIKGTRIAHQVLMLPHVVRPSSSFGQPLIYLIDTLAGPTKMREVRSTTGLNDRPPQPRVWQSSAHTQKPHTPVDKAGQGGGMKGYRASSRNRRSRPSPQGHTLETKQ